MTPIEDRPVITVNSHNKSHLVNGEVGRLGGIRAHTGEDVLAGGHGEAGVGVAEALGDDLDGDAGGDEQGGVSVAQVVEPDRGHGESGDLSGDNEGGVEPQVFGGVEEPPELMGGPAVGAVPLTMSWFGGAGSVGGIGGDELGVDGVVERRAADDVNVVHGFRREAPLAYAAGGEKVGVEPVEVFGAQ